MQRVGRFEGPAVRQYINWKKNSLGELNCIMWVNGNMSAHMSNETQPLSTAACWMEQERLPTAASREEKGRWGRAVKFYVTYWKTPRSPSDAEKQAQVCEAAFCQQIHFSKRSMHCRKKHGSPSQRFPLHPLSQLLHSEEASSEPVILNRVEFYCAWHILEWSHCGLRSVFSFHPTKRKSWGLSTIPAISRGTAAGRGGRAAC